MTFKFREYNPKKMKQISVLFNDSYNLIMSLGKREPTKSKANVRR